MDDFAQEVVKSHTTKDEPYFTVGKKCLLFKEICEGKNIQTTFFRENKPENLTQDISWEEFSELSMKEKITAAICSRVDETHDIIVFSNSNLSLIIEVEHQGKEDKTFVFQFEFLVLVGNPQ